jgi:hypothetical protein
MWSPPILAPEKGISDDWGSESANHGRRRQDGPPVVVCTCMAGESQESVTQKRRAEISVRAMRADAQVMVP